MKNDQSAYQANNHTENWQYLDCIFFSTFFSHPTLTVDSLELYREAHNAYKTIKDTEKIDNIEKLTIL